MSHSEGKEWRTSPEPTDPIRPISPEPISPASLHRPAPEADPASSPVESLGITAIQAYGVESPDIASTPRRTFEAIADESLATRADFVDTEFQGGGPVRTLHLETDDGPDATIKVTITKADTGAPEIVLVSDEPEAAVRGMHQRKGHYTLDATGTVRYSEGTYAVDEAVPQANLREVAAIIAEAEPLHVYASDIVHPTPHGPFEVAADDISPEHDALIEAGLAAQDLCAYVERKLAETQQNPTEPGIVTQGATSLMTDITENTALYNLELKADPQTGELTPLAMVYLAEREVPAIHAQNAALQSAEGGPYKLSPHFIASMDWVEVRHHVLYRVQDGLLKRHETANYVGVKGEDRWRLGTSREPYWLASRAEARRLRNFFEHPRGRR